VERVARTKAALAGRIAPSKLPKPFSVPFVTPPVLEPVRRTATADIYDITMRNASVEILPGLRTEIWGYNGITPGPTIQVARAARRSSGRPTSCRHGTRRCSTSRRPPCTCTARRPSRSTTATRAT
jgi:hypothetical protein